VISFRSHLVSLIAVFLALAVGVVLGGGPLSEVGRASTGTASQTGSGGENADAAYTDAFVTQTAPKLLTGRLTGETVVLVTMPGADPQVVRGAASLVKTAGGAVVGEYDVQPALVDPNEKSLVDTLGSQLLTSLKAKNIPATTPTYERMGRLIGLGVATPTASGAAVDAAGTQVMESVKGADLMKTKSTSRRGALVLVVLGDEPSKDTGVDVIVSGLVKGLRAASQGVVVAGSTDSGENGLLSLLRDNDDATAAASLTDSVQTGAGRVTAVLALGAAKDGTIGSFGASGADGAVPLG
jgi:hypothetical protein